MLSMLEDPLQESSFLQNKASLNQGFVEVVSNTDKEESSKGDFEIQMTELKKKANFAPV